MKLKKITRHTCLWPCVDIGYAPVFSFPGLTNPEHALKPSLRWKRSALSAQLARSPRTGEGRGWTDRQMCRSKRSQERAPLGGMEGRWRPGAGRGARCWGRVSSGPQVSVIPVLWEPRREERGRCADLLVMLPVLEGAWGSCSAFSSPFIALSKSDKPFGSPSLEEPVPWGDERAGM